MNKRIKKKLKKRANIFKYKKYKSTKRLLDRILGIGYSRMVYTFKEANSWDELVDMAIKEG